jgi:hypothetical protein
MKILVEVSEVFVQDAHGGQKLVRRGGQVSLVPLGQPRYNFDCASAVVRKDTLEHMIRIIGPGPVYTVTSLEETENGGKLYFLKADGIGHEGFLASNFIIVE